MKRQVPILMGADNEQTDPPAEGRLGLYVRASLPLVAVALACSVHVLFLVSLSTWMPERLGSGLLNSLFNDAVHRLGQGSDFFAVYQAGHNLLNGIDIYAADVTSPAVPYSYPFRYLPIMAATLGVVANALTPMTAYWVWVGINEILLLVSIALTASLGPNRRTRLWTTAMWLAFSPFYLELYMGQFSFAMATLFVLMGYALLRGRPQLMSFAWIASVLWKLNSLIITPLLIRLRSYRALLLCVGLILLLSLPYFMLMPGTLRPFLKANLGGAGTQFSFHAGNLGFQALTKDVLARVWRRLIGTSWTVEAAQGIALLVVGTVVALSLWATFRRDGLMPLPSLAMWITSYFLIYQDVWEHHYVMLLPALVLLYLYSCLQRESAVPRWMLIWVFVMVAIPTPFVFIDAQGLAYSEDPQPLWAWWQSLIYHSWKSVPTLLLWAALVGRGIARTRHPRPVIEMRASMNRDGV